MTLTLELTPEQEQSLEAEAQQRGMDRASYAKTLIFEDEHQERMAEIAAQAKEENWSGADLVAFWEREGIIGSRPDITDSLEYARALRHKAERRVRE